MTQMLLRSAEMIEHSTIEQSQVDSDAGSSSVHKARCNQLYVAGLFTKADPIAVDIHHSLSDMKPDLDADWTFLHKLSGFVVGVHMTQDPTEYAGLVPIITDVPFPTGGHYVASGPRFLDPVMPEVERYPQGEGWLMYVLKHDVAA